MNIRHKGIIKDRYDAPFIGTLVSAISCKFNCEDCCNDYLKTSDYSSIDANELIDNIVFDPIQEGIILGGLEWTLQPEELMHIIDLALKKGLKVMLYTGLPNKIELLSNVPSLFLFEGRGVYVKYGLYDKNNIDHEYQMYGVPLISRNQYIEIL